MQEDLYESSVAMNHILRLIVPPLTHSSHKGASGRIGIIGGSLEYTGAPFFAAISAMKTGADLAHVFCPEDAAPVIKSYSPELIVHPLLSSKLPENEVVASITAWFPRMHSLIIGPGLGRDAVIMSHVKSIILEAKRMQKSIIVDADGLYLVTNEPEVIVGYKNAILTPNGGEFPRLYEAMFGTGSVLSGDICVETKSLASKMGGVTICRKGRIDVITDGLKLLQCEEEGSVRRCGGQGDVLSGIIGLLTFWANQKDKELIEFGLPPTIVAAFGGCFLTKRCAKDAFSKHHRSMLAQDVVNEIPSVFNKYFENEHDTV